MKRIVVCMDGTWQTLAQDPPTNIGIIARSLAHTDMTSGKPIEQVAIYAQGVGTTMGRFPGAQLFDQFQANMTRTIGGAFGVGLEETIFNAYLQLVLNYEDGDEIYIFGFSRGAFAARRLSGLINSAGIVSRMFAEKALEGFNLYQDTPPFDADPALRAAHHEKEREFRIEYGKGARNPDGSRRKIAEPPPIKYLGVFDTVKQRGFSEVVSGFWPRVSRRSKLKSLLVCPNVLSARHAVAIDECRIGFPSTIWEKLDESNAAAHARPGADPNYKYYDQRWFVGMHGDIGGGDTNGLAALALKWIAEGAAKQGLRFYEKHGNDESLFDAKMAEADLVFDRPIKRPPLLDALKPINYPFRGRRIWMNKDAPDEKIADIMFDPSVHKRWVTIKNYRPPPLAPFKKVWTPPRSKAKHEDAKP